MSDAIRTCIVAEDEALLRDALVAELKRAWPSLRSTPMPAMMLQTLVENAIKHGLEPRTGGGTVWIRARRDDNTVAVTVADNGEGFNTKTSGTGIGLKNVRERLRLRYAGAANLAVVANFPAGVAATLTVPANGHNANV